MLTGKNISLRLNALFREKSGLDNNKREPERRLRRSSHFTIRFLQMYTVESVLAYFEHIAY